MIVQLNALRIQEIEMSRGEFMLFSKPEAGLFRSTRENWTARASAALLITRPLSKTTTTLRGR